MQVLEKPQVSASMCTDPIPPQFMNLFKMVSHLPYFFPPKMVKWLRTCSPLNLNGLTPTKPIPNTILANQKQSSSGHCVHCVGHRQLRLQHSKEKLISGGVTLTVSWMTAVWLDNNSYSCLKYTYAWLGSYSWQNQHWSGRNEKPTFIYFFVKSMMQISSVKLATVITVYCICTVPERKAWRAQSSNWANSSFFIVLKN